MSEVKLNHLTTERRNEKTMNLDTLSTHELLEIMNEEDHKVPEAVREAIPEIEKAVQAIIKALRNGGRLIYMGAGTSGRLGVIDSAECMPTFGTTYEVVGLLAGGPGAFLTAVEGAEDDAELGKQDLVDQKLTEKDVVCGIAASGRTPYPSISIWSPATASTSPVIRSFLTVILSIFPFLRRRSARLSATASSSFSLTANSL